MDCVISKSSAKKIQAREALPICFCTSRSLTFDSELAALSLTLKPIKQAPAPSLIFSIPLDEGQQYGGDREVASVAMLPPTCLVVWTGDAQQTLGGADVRRNRQRSVPNCHYAASVDLKKTCFALSAG